MLSALTVVAFAGDRPLLPPGCLVVLLAGLAGDNETDKTYREEMVTWLRVLEDQGTCERVFVLCEETNTIALR
jgi:hypothetical protein